MAADDRVEWGGGSGGGAVPGAGRAVRDAARARSQRLAVGCALAGFGALIAAELLPWAVVQLGTPGAEGEAPGGRGRIEVGLDQIGAWPVLVYHVGWSAIFALTAAALVAGGARRVIAAAGIGAAGGQLALLVGLARAIGHGAGTVGGGLMIRVGEDDLPPITYAPGLYCAFAATALVLCALALSGGVPDRELGRGVAGPDDDADSGPTWGRRHDDDLEAGPPDLTVTSLGSYDEPVGERDIDSSGGPPSR